MGVYSTCQFLGAFAGGAAGGWMLQYLGESALIATCLLLAILWWLAVFVAAHPVGQDDEVASRPLSDL